MRQAVADMHHLYNHSCSIISREDGERYQKSLEYLVELSEVWRCDANIHRECPDGEEEKGTHDN